MRIFSKIRVAYLEDLYDELANAPKDILEIIETRPSGHRIPALFSFHIKGGGEEYNLKNSKLSQMAVRGDDIPGWDNLKSADKMLYIQWALDQWREAAEQQGLNIDWLHKDFPNNVTVTEEDARRLFGEWLKKVGFENIELKSIKNDLFGNYLFIFAMDWTTL